MCAEKLINFEPIVPLFDYQIRAIEKALTHKKGVFFSFPPGAGKTIPAITFLHTLIKRKEIENIIVVSTSSLLFQWNDVIKKLLGDQYECFFIDPSKRNVKRYWSEYQDFINSGKNKVYLMRYSSFMTNRKYLELQYTAHDNTSVVLDESSAIKNIKSNTSKNIKKYFKLFEYKMILNGTMYGEGNMEHAYSQLQFIDYLGKFPKSIQEFNIKHSLKKTIQHDKYKILVPLKYEDIKRITVRIEKLKYLNLSSERIKNDITLYYGISESTYEKIINKNYGNKTVVMSNSKEFFDNAKVYSLLYQHKYDNEKNDTTSIYKDENYFIKSMKCPDPEEETFFLKAGKEEKDRYKSILSEISIDEQNYLSIASRFIYSSYGYISNSFDEDFKPYYMDEKLFSKFDKLFELLERHPHEQKIIWCNYVSGIERLYDVLHKKYKNETISCLYGGVKQSKRKDIITSFKEKSIDILVANPSIIGKGIDLVKCNIAIFFTLGFSGEDFIQTKSRILRAGKKSICHIYYIIGDNKIEKSIYNLLIKKQDLTENVAKNIIEREKETCHG